MSVNIDAIYKSTWEHYQQAKESLIEKRAFFEHSDSAISNVIPGFDADKLEFGSYDKENYAVLFVDMRNSTKRAQNIGAEKTFLTMHVFLTGEIQLGKSTAIKKYLETRRGADVRGFLTVSPYNNRPDRPVYIIPAQEKEPIYSDKRICLLRRPGCFEPRPEVFDTIGVEILAGAENGELILMDEIGRAESRAALFRSRIEELIEGKVPILGVIQKKAEGALADFIYNHPNVTVITLTTENRNSIPMEISDILG